MHCQCFYNNICATAIASRKTQNCVRAFDLPFQWVYTLRGVSSWPAMMPLVQFKTAHALTFEGLGGVGHHQVCVAAQERTAQQTPSCLFFVGPFEHHRGHLSDFKSCQVLRMFVNTKSVLAAVPGPTLFLQTQRTLAVCRSSKIVMRQTRSGVG
jgi:hypothetical protein